MSATVTNSASQTGTFGIQTGAQWVLLVLLTGYFVGSLLNDTLEGASLILLLLWSLGALFTHPRPFAITREQKLLMVGFVAYFLAALISWIVMDMDYDGRKMVFRYARFVLFIPILLLLRRYLVPAAVWVPLIISTWVVGLWSALEWPQLIAHSYDDWAPRLSGAINPIQFGGLILAQAALLAMWTPRVFGHSRLLGWMAALGVAAAVLCSVGSGTRGVMIAIPLVAVCAYWGMVRMGSVPFRPARVAAFALLAGVVVTALFSKTWIGNYVKSGFDVAMDYSQSESIEEYMEPGGHGYSTAARIEMLRMAWLIFEDYPVLGVGPRNYRPAAKAQVAEGDGHEAAVIFRHPHSEYFSVLATRGLVGMIALGLFFGLPLWVFWKNTRNTSQDARHAAWAGLVVIVFFLQIALTSALFELTSYIGLYLITIATMGALATRSTTSESKQAE